MEEGGEGRLEVGDALSGGSSIEEDCLYVCILSSSSCICSLRAPCCSHDDHRAAQSPNNVHTHTHHLKNTQLHC